jgi:hypothetical protein
VGVVGTTSSVYFYLQGTSFGTMSISESIHSIDPSLAVGKVRTADEVVTELRAQPRLRAELTGSFALLTILLAASGVYGVMT